MASHYDVLYPLYSAQDKFLNANLAIAFLCGSDTDIGNACLAKRNKTYQARNTYVFGMENLFQLAIFPFSLIEGFMYPLQMIWYNSSQAE